MGSPKLFLLKETLLSPLLSCLRSHSLKLKVWRSRMLAMRRNDETATRRQWPDSQVAATGKVR